MGRRPKVAWTKEERERVAEQFVLLRLNDPFANVTQLLVEAQNQTLEKSRHRTPILSIETDFRSLIEQKFTSSVDTLRGEPIVVEKEVLIQAKTDEQVLADMPLDELCSVAVKRLVNERMSIAPLLSTAMAQPSVSELPQLPPVDKSQRPSKCRILIVGTFNQQSTDIKERCKGYTDLELTFIHGDRAPAKIDSSADFIIVYKTSHSWMHSVKASMNGSGDKVIYCKDGVKGLCAKIVELRSRWIAQRNSMWSRAKVG